MLAYLLSAWEFMPCKGAYRCIAHKPLPHIYGTL